MICNKYYKLTRDKINFYFPDLKECVFTEQYKKDRGRNRFEMPEGIKYKKAQPMFPVENELFNKLSFKSQMIATSLFQLFLYGKDKLYPEVICTEIERGKYLKFQFFYFYTYDFMNMPCVHYEPMEVISKKEAKNCQVCLDLE